MLTELTLLVNADVIESLPGVTTPHLNLLLRERFAGLSALAVDYKGNIACR